jgi:hypothetical protein
VHLDEAVSDRIVDAVRPHLPPQVTIRRSSPRTLHVKTVKSRFEIGYGSAAAFAHASRSEGPAQSAATVFKIVLHEVTTTLRDIDMHWPGLDFGPVEIETGTDGEVVTAKITDRHGAVLSFDPVRLH